jgi:hypothetical protein
MAQRAIVYAAAVGGLTEDQCNKILASAKFPAVNSSSWKMVQANYVPAFKQRPELIGKCVVKPRSIRDLNKELTDLIVAEEKRKEESESQEASKLPWYKRWFS